MNNDALTIKKFHEGLVNKVFSAREALHEFYKTIDVRDGKISAYLSTDREAAQTQAEEIDRMVDRGEKLPLLAGVPLAIKDTIMIKGQPCMAASKILEKYTAIYDATVIKKLRSEGSIFIGKANMDEFAMGSSTEVSAFKVTKNPRDITKVPGGSSGGSAAAVAGGMAVAALGSDTGGSIRQAAGFCGIVGLKPTYGAVSRSGLMAMGSSLDQIGPITKSVADAEIIFDAIKGQDPLDSTSIDFSRSDLSSGLSRSDLKLKIGVPRHLFKEGIDADVLE